MQFVEKNINFEPLVESSKVDWVQKFPSYQTGTMLV